MNSDVSNKSIIQALKNLGYIHTANKTEVVSDKNRSINCKFFDQKKDLLPVHSLILVNTNNHTFTIYQGTLGKAENILFLEESDNHCIIGETRNGDIFTFSKLEFALVSIEKIIISTRSLMWIQLIH